MWVKASGQRLADAASKQVFVPLSLDRVLSHLDEGKEDLGSCIVTADAAPHLKPSIETYLHALMRHRVVIHAHSISSTTTSVLADGETRAAAALHDISWRWIPYRRPGISLAKCVLDIVGDEVVDALVLQNHGVLIGASSIEAAEGLLGLVERRLDLPARALPSCDEQPLHGLENDEYEACLDLSAIAFDPVSLSILADNTLVPDQVVFLGGAVPVKRGDESLSFVAERVWESSGVRPAIIVAAGIGAVGRRDRTPAADLQFNALVEVARRIPVGAPITGLSDKSIAELRAWDAEAYRQAIDLERRRS